MDYRLDQRLLVMRRRDLRHIHQQRSYRYFVHSIGLIDEKKAAIAGLVIICILILANKK